MTFCCPFYRSLFDVFWESVGAGKVSSLYQGLGTKNLQSVISQFIYFYSYSIFKQWYLAKAKVSRMGTGSNLLVAAAAGTCTAVLTQVLKLTKCFNLRICMLFEITLLIPNLIMFYCVLVCTGTYFFL